MSGDKDKENQELLDKLEVVGKGGWFLWKIFLLCMIPSILNGLNVTSYVYLAEVPPHRCKIPELENTTWTEQQIRLVSSPANVNESSCLFYDWNYSILSKMSFQEALVYTQSKPKPQELPCSSYSYDPASSSMVVNYDLVCERTALKSTVQVALSLGKFLGAFVFGIISDRYGRRLSFFIGSILYIASGPLVGFAADYVMVIIGRIGLGAAGSAIYHSAFVILSEVANKKRRAMLGIVYNMSYPIGQMLIPLIAYFIRDWRDLQLAISAPAVLILVFYWFMPESPRWLLSKGRRAEARKIIDEAYESHLKGRDSLKAAPGDDVVMTIVGGTSDGTRPPPPATEPAPVSAPTHAQEEPEQSQLQRVWAKLLTSMSQLHELLRYSELRNRLVIMLFCWCVCSLSYYALALNVDNFNTDRYLYGFLTGLVEAPSYVLPLPFLRCLGRRHAAILLFYVGGVALLCILAFPRDEGSNIGLLVVASLGRLCVSGVFAVIILHTTELFPTLLRNTAIGCGSTFAHIGSMTAPLLVDLLGAQAWYIPSTVCGVTTVLAGTLIFVLPETKNKALPETVEEIVEAGTEDQTGFHQICR